MKIRPTLMKEVELKIAEYWLSTQKEMNLTNCGIVKDCENCEIFKNFVKNCENCENCEIL